MNKFYLSKFLLLVTFLFFFFLETNNNQLKNFLDIKNEFFKKISYYNQK